MSRNPAEALGAATIALLVTLAPPRSAWAGEDDFTLDLGASSLELRRIPKGTFVQGSPTTEVGREPDEIPHEVTISKPFWIGRVPITRAQFSRFVTETRFVTEAEKSPTGGFGWDVRGLVQKKEFTWRNPGFPQKDEDPAVLISFADASAFTTWASKKSGRRIRLPTEAEWEYAARAGTKTPWFGATKEDEALALGWFKSNARYTTHPVGLKRANAFGLFDTSGNVFEWCRDVYAPYPSGPVIDPVSTAAAAGDPERRVLRGGSWLRDVKRSRSAARHKTLPTSRNAETGFRIVMDEPDAEPPPHQGLAAPTPVGTGSSTPSPATADADAGASTQPNVPPRPPSEGSPWSLIGAPFASAAAVVAWVLLRRRRGAGAVAAGPPLQSASPPSGPVSVSGPARDPFALSPFTPLSPAAPFSPVPPPSGPPPSVSPVPPASVSPPPSAAMRAAPRSVPPPLPARASSSVMRAASPGAAPSPFALSPSAAPPPAEPAPVATAPSESVLELEPDPESARDLEAERGPEPEPGKD